MSVDDRRVLNCANPEPLVVLPLVRPCEMTWGQLEPTEDERVRICARCVHEVHKVANVVEARVRARQGECLAVPPEVYDRVQARYRAEHEAGQRVIIGFFSPEIFIDRMLEEG